MAIIEPTVYEAVEPGTYRAVISSIEESTHPEYGRQLKLVFTLLGEEDEETDTTIWAYCGAKWNPKSKLFEWSRAILRNKCPQPDEPFDYDLLKGRKADIEVAMVKSKTTGQERTAVVKVYPFRTMTAAEDEAA